MDKYIIRSRIVKKMNRQQKPVLSRVKKGNNFVYTLQTKEGIIEQRITKRNYIACTANGEFYFTSDNVEEQKKYKEKRESKKEKIKFDEFECYNYPQELDIIILEEIKQNTDQAEEIRALLTPIIGQMVVFAEPIYVFGTIMNNTYLDCCNWVGLSDNNIILGASERALYLTLSTEYGKVLEAIKKVINNYETPEQIEQRIRREILERRL